MGSNYSPSEVSRIKELDTQIIKKEKEKANQTTKKYMIKSLSEIFTSTVIQVIYNC